MATAAASPGRAYWLGTRLYVALTNASNATPLIQLRGPGFSMPRDSGFQPLPEGDEPSAQEIFEVVDSCYASDARKNVSGMGEDDTGVTFAGLGEPLLRLDVLNEAAQLIRERRHGVPLRIKTNGLVPGGDTDGAARALAEAGVRAASVALPCADPKSYEELMQPQDGANFGVVCGFISSLAEAGIEVECTAVQRPGVDLQAIRALAQALGAVETRAVTYHE